MNKRICISYLLVFLVIYGSSCSKGFISSGAVKDGYSRADRISGYSIEGNKFAYYKIGKDVPQDVLTELAQKIHDSEPDTQLIFVDDDSELNKYINYVKAVSGPGDVSIEMPKEWADKHIVANIQKYMNGKFVLCKGYGYMEIADLK